MPKNYSVKGLLKNNLFLPILQSKEPVLTKKKNLTTVLQVLKVFMEPFSQNGSSMASWSTFVLKSVCKIGLTIFFLMDKRTK